MSSKSILFSAPMVRALLDGSKTQTRRVMNPQPEYQYHPTERELVLKKAKGPGYWSWAHAQAQILKTCPYGQPGDQLQVREAFRFEKLFDTWAPRNMPPSSGIWYETNGAAPEWMGKLRPGMFMPGWASRITLQITEIRIERLQDISEADARAEGVSDTKAAILDPDNRYVTGPIAEYAVLWDAINGAGAWEQNPYVWAVTFQRMQANGASA